MQTDLWKITCEEHLYPGLWQRWFRSQCVALGWPPQDGFHLDGTGVQGLGKPCLTSRHHHATWRSRLGMASVCSTVTDSTERRSWEADSCQVGSGDWSRGSRIRSRIAARISTHRRATPNHAGKGDVGSASGPTSTTNARCQAISLPSLIDWRTGCCPILSRRRESAAAEGERGWMSC
jgi:hypothetical protein